MSAVQLSREGAVWVLTMTQGDNRFNDASLAEWHAALDTVESTTGPVALVITSADPKFFSNGIDLEGIFASHGAEYLINTFVPRLDAFLLRMARFPMPVVMAMNGHAYAGGALLAATGDFRVMRADRGRFCFPEVDIKLPFTPIMDQIVKLLPNAQAAWTMAVTAAAWGGEECLQRGVVDAAVGESEVLPSALAMAQQLAGKDRSTYAAIKRRWRSAFEPFV
ncbi:MAG: enoyl-CoA hydratase/isomerase family protein [Pseudomonadota bacterium]